MVDARDVRIRGVVQGVGFRDYVQLRARQLTVENGHAILPAPWLAK